MIKPLLVKWLGFTGSVLFCIAIDLPAFASEMDGGDSTSHSYSAEGIVLQISPDHHQVTIHHQAIPGYMMEMTMDFPVHDPAELNSLAPGDQVTFTLMVDKDTAWITHVHRIGHVDLPATHAMSMPMTEVGNARLQPGEPFPDFALLAENGTTIHLSDFRGKAVAFTFFFTRCPLPNYCPLMNRNFSQARQLLLADSKIPNNWQFLSISFDPDFDQPQTLASYAAFYRGKSADRWLFASVTPTILADIAPHIGLMVMGEGGNLAHNLRTVVLDPQGRLYRQYNDNLWTPRQLADAVSAAAHLAAPK